MWGTRGTEREEEGGGEGGTEKQMDETCSSRSRMVEDFAPCEGKNVPVAPLIPGCETSFGRARVPRERVMHAGLRNSRRVIKLNGDNPTTPNIARRCANYIVRCT